MGHRRWLDGWSAISRWETPEGDADAPDAFGHGAALWAVVGHVTLRFRCTFQPAYHAVKVG